MAPAHPSQEALKPGQRRSDFEITEAEIVVVTINRLPNRVRIERMSVMNEIDDHPADLATISGRNVIAIDGPAGSGKTTIASLLAEYLGAIYLDTGVLYRAATLLSHRLG